ncbi:MAG: rhomboid family intramembrane serine protease [Planctomycetota bacterium]|nr:rhomboid family intramembrane serine protease [Planctomycetota bacterium]
MIVPWCVDVPQERWPVVNWLIVVAAIVVFVLQSAEFTQAASEPMPATDSSTVPGITGALMLNGWNFTGLFGHIWIHGDLMHLLGNMWFLWIFGNAVCAKVGNLRYLVLYVLLGTTAGVTHLLFDSRPALGASGAINGVVACIWCCSTRTASPAIGRQS